MIRPFAEWVYKATTARRDFEDTRELATKYGFIARSAYSKSKKLIANVRKVAVGDFLHFYYRRPERPEPVLLGSFRVRDASSDPRRFDAVSPEGALVAVKQSPENKALLESLYRVPKHPRGAAYVDDPVLHRMTGWFVETVEPFGPAYEKSLFPGQGTLQPYLRPATEVRWLLDQVLIGEDELDAFSADFFPQVWRRFSSGMPRVHKQTLLLQETTPGALLQALRDYNEHRFYPLLFRVRTASVAPESPPSHATLGVESASVVAVSVPGTPVGDIFRTSGQPEYNFVEPEQSEELFQRLRIRGEGLLVEGPSGVGKTTAVDRALRKLGVKDVTVWLSAMAERDKVALDEHLDSDFAKGGYLVVDDFHRLDRPRQEKLTNLIKVLSDRNRRDAKVTLIGVNPIRSSLLTYFPDVFARFSSVLMGRQPDEKVAELIHRGETAANIAFKHRDALVAASLGSFVIAQRLCFEAAMRAKVFEAGTRLIEIDLTPESVIGRVQRDLSAKLGAYVVSFAAFDESAPPRGACLSLLWHLSRSDSASVSLHDFRYRDPSLTPAFQWLLASNLGGFFDGNQEVQKILHYNRSAGVLSAEDPQLEFYLHHLDWDALARNSGNTVARWDPEQGPTFRPRPAEAPAGAVVHAPVITQEPPPATGPKGHEPSPSGAEKRTLILHLSDLHFGTVNDAQRWHNELATDLQIELKVARLDALIVSGDIGNRADPDEYVAARRFLQGVMSEFGLSPQRIVLVPGNHDLSWTLSEKAYTPQRRSSYKGALIPGTYIGDEGDKYIELRSEAEYRERFRPFADFYESVRMEPYPLDYAEQATVQHLPEQNIVILGLNSAWNLDHHFKDRAGINPDALARALTQIRNNPTYSSCLKMAVWHHPVSGAGEDRIKDTAFLEQLAQAGFQLALHGHQHKATNEDFRYDHGGKRRGIEILSAGTFGAPTKEWNPGIPLQYQLLDIRGRTLTVGTRRRNDPNGAWKPDAIWGQGAGEDPLPRYEITLRAP